MGYSDILVSRTLLGRVKIEADGDEGRREIIVNPRTGEILRDLFLRLGDGAEGRLLRDDGNRSSGRSSRGDDDDRDDDSADDGDDDDDDDSGGDSDGGGGGSDDD